MKVAFLPYVNAPKPEGSTVYDPSIWRFEVENAFLGSDDIPELTSHIDELRQCGKAVKAECTVLHPSHAAASGEDTTCYPHYISHLREPKKERQARWLSFLEQAYAAQVAQAMETLKSNMGDEFDKTLVVAALPEFFWRDIDDAEKHLPAPFGASQDAINGYGKPIYSDVFWHFMGEREDNALRGLTELYSNLIIFAGTVWWKQVQDYRPCEKQCEHEFSFNGYNGRCLCELTTRLGEYINNTMPVYYRGRLIKLLNKQTISNIDGLGSEGAYKMFGRGYLSQNITARIPELLAQMNDLTQSDSTMPLVSIDFDGVPVNFSCDICLDFVRAFDDHNQPQSTPTSNSRYCLETQKRAPAHLQVLVAAGMPVQGMTLNPYISSTLGLLRCDAIADNLGSYADMAPADGTAVGFNQVAETIYCALHDFQPPAV